MESLQKDVLQMQDSSRTVLFTDYVDAVRRATNPRRIYVMMGNTSHVFCYRTPQQANEDYLKVVETLDDGFEMGDEEPSVISLDAVMGVRDYDNQDALLVMFPSWTLICKYPTVEERKAAYDRTIASLLSSH